MRRWYRFVLEAAAAVSLVGGCLGCSSESERAPGVLMLALSTDMQVPKDFDKVLVEVGSADSEPARCKLLAWPDAEGTQAAYITSQCKDMATDTTALRLPATLGLESDQARKATVTVKAYRGSELVVCRKLEIRRLPSAGDKTVPMLRVPIAWVTTEEAGEDPSKCAVMDSQPLETYNAATVFGGATDPGSDGTCFDTLRAVRSASRITPSGDTCTLAGVEKDSSLTWVKPAGTMGICGRAACFVPVDAESVDAWRAKSGSLRLPEEVCEQLKSGAVRAVLETPKDTAKTQSIPTCGPWSSVTSQPGSTEDPVPLAKELLAYWNFDDGAQSKTWLDATYQGHDLRRGAASDATTRVGGRGAAARFNGSAHTALTEAQPFQRQAFTLSAWVSFGPEDIAKCTDTTWPVLSTRSSACSGYELGIRCIEQNGRLEPYTVFAYGCDELAVPLPKNSGKWTAGDWYHLAATHAYGESNTGRAALFLDGSLAAEDAEATTVSFDEQSLLHLGKGFNGYLDDVLVFGRALDEASVRELHATSTTARGPSGMRWGVWDAKGSVASLGENSQEQNLRVRVVEEKQCSSGGAVAHLSETQVRQLLYGADTAVLDAAIEADTDDAEAWFEFSMSGPHGRPQCTWYGVVGERKDHGYEFDLKRPNWCANSDACAIDPGSMRTVTISTHWKQRASLDLSVRSLEFWPSPEEWEWNGRDEPLGSDASACWRPVTYEPAPIASALWVDPDGNASTWENPSWPVQLAAELSDPGEGSGSTAEAAAFILGDPLDLSRCTSIQIDWGADVPSKRLELAIENADGVTCSLGFEPTSGLQTVALPGSGCYDCEGQQLDVATVETAVTRVALRKQWNASLEKAPLTIDGIRFLDENDAACALHAP